MTWRALVRLWLLIEEPRVRRVLWSWMYGVVAAGGLSALVSPPTSIASSIGPALTMIWACLLITGGGVGAWSTLTRWWVVERAAIWLAGAGSLIYVAVVVYNHFSTDGNRLPQASFVIAFIVALGIRMWDIRRLNRRPD